MQLESMHHLESIKVPDNDVSLKTGTKFKLDNFKYLNFYFSRQAIDIFVTGEEER